MSDARLPVLLYDGTCRLCNGSVFFLLRHDRRGALHFAPLQSPPAQDFLRLRGLPTADFDSLVYVRDWNRRADSPFLLRTDGALAAAGELGGPWARAAALRLVPSFLRDAAYRLVARSRRVLFGDYVPGPLPDPAWAGRFLAR
jgi:predicted DCC family thiol-disulfide oxidoreductase YuxK